MNTGLCVQLLHQIYTVIHIVAHTASYTISIDACSVLQKDIVVMRRLNPDINGVELKAHVGTSRYLRVSVFHFSVTVACALTATLTALTLSA